MACLPVVAEDAEGIEDNLFIERLRAFRESPIFLLWKLLLNFFQFFPISSVFQLN